MRVECLGEAPQARSLAQAALEAFITKLTTFLVFLFFLNCLALAYIAKSNVSEESIIVTDDVGIEEQNSDELQDQSEENNSLDEINIPD